MAILSNHWNPILDTAQPIAGGFNTEVFLLSGGDMVAKVVGGNRHSSDKKITFIPQQAETLGKQIEQYTLLLREVGIAVPDYFSWAVSIDDQTVKLIVLQSFVGFFNAKKMLLDADPHTARDITASILSALRPIFTDGVMGKVGIDPKPENFFPHKGTTHYVDVMPPRFLAGSRAIVEYPEPATTIGYQLGFWKHFTPVGITTMLLTQLARIRPTMFDLFWQEISSWLRRRGDNQTVDQLSAHILSKSNGVKKAIDMAENPYQLRLIASQLVHHGGVAENRLEQVFSLTHYEDGDFSEPLAQAKQLALMLV